VNILLLQPTHSRQNLNRSKNCPFRNANTKINKNPFVGDFRWQKRAVRPKKKNDFLTEPPSFNDSNKYISLSLNLWRSQSQVRRTNWVSWESHYFTAVSTIDTVRSRYWQSGLEGESCLRSTLPAAPYIERVLENEPVPTNSYLSTYSLQRTQFHALNLGCFKRTQWTQYSYSSSQVSMFCCVHSICLLLHI